MHRADDIPPGGDPGRLARTARDLLARGGVLQSTAAGEQIDDGALREALEQHLAAAAPADPAGTLSARAAAADVAAAGRRALDRVAAGESASNLTDHEVSSLEAIVLVTGRPATRYPRGRVQMPALELGENDLWRVLVATERATIDRASASVGQVARDPGQPVGTAWRLGGDLVVTNRHVARELVADPGAPPESWSMDPGRPAWVDFAATDEPGGPCRFGVAALAYVAPEEWVDVAVLRLVPGTAPMPAALPLDWSPSTLGAPADGEDGDSFRGEGVYVVGHPYRPYGGDAVRAVFGHADGLKRWSPGRVTGVHPGRPLLEHDCSTLGGSSGSCVLSVQGHRVVGLHFGGRDVDLVTAMGAANLAVALSRLGAHPCAEILRDGRVPG